MKNNSRSFSIQGLKHLSELVLTDENSDLQAGIWFGNVAPSPIITTPIHYGLVVFIFEVIFIFDVIFIFEVIFLIYSMSRPNLHPANSDLFAGLIQNIVTYLADESDK